MDEITRMQLKVRRAFSSYCVHVIKNELANACRDKKQRQVHEIIFSELNPYQMNQLYCYDSYFKDDVIYSVAGREISAKSLKKALFSLPEEKKELVELYYFFDMSDKQISNLHHVPRSTVQHRRVSSLDLLRLFLEEDTNEF